MNLPSLSNFTTRELTVPVGDEDVAVGRDRDVARAAERIGAVAANALGAERHQQLPVGTVFEDLLADAVASLAVGDPQVAEAIDANAVRPREQLLAPLLEDLAASDRTRRSAARRDETRRSFRSASIAMPGTSPHVAPSGSTPQPGTSRYGAACPG